MNGGWVLDTLPYFEEKLDILRAFIDFLVPKKYGNDSWFKVMCILKWDIQVENG